MEPFIETRSGREFYPLEPRSRDIDIVDIAHALSNQCRFSGHTREHYSVAEHCVRVSELLEAWGCSRAVQLWGLLHDASEAYLVDIPSPLKAHPDLAAYKTYERRLMTAIAIRFGLDVVEPMEVRAADATLLATEARDLMAYRPAHWTKLTAAPLSAPIVPWSHEAARACFLARFEALTTPPDADADTEDSPTLIPNGEEA